MLMLVCPSFMITITGYNRIRYYVMLDVLNSRGNLLLMKNVMMIALADKCR
ncbi:MAG: hypothetical protein QXO37_08045 [Candidatus Nitrosocaldaceae archaeon]